MNRKSEREKQRKKGAFFMLELKHIKKSFDGVPVLKNINLEIEDGEIVSILGPSGCGKTTLLNMIGLIDKPDSGSILVEDRNILAYGQKRLSTISFGK